MAQVAVAVFGLSEFLKESSHVSLGAAGDGCYASL